MNKPSIKIKYFITVLIITVRGRYTGTTKELGSKHPILFNTVLL